MKRELFVNMTHILDTEFTKNTVTTSAQSQKSIPNTYKIRCFAASPIFVHFDVRYVILRRVSPTTFLEFLPFSQTQLRELQTFSPRHGTTRPWEFQLFQDLERISFRQSSFFPVS